jgi:N-acetylglutamate synthase-like GNAT family acetyltransferase
MKIKIIEFGTEEYKDLVSLRIEALLEPIGISSNYIVPENEKDDVFIGAFEKEKFIGCCVLTAKENGIVQLRQMAVRPVMQAKGIGAAIIQFAEKTAVEKGFHLLMMHARDPVIGFYEKCGYHIVGEQFFEVGMGHHQMEKLLTKKT